MFLNNNKRTEHGENIANQIQDSDAYGRNDSLTASDLWNILDQFETHLMDTPELPERRRLQEIVAESKRKLENAFPEMERA